MLATLLLSRNLLFLDLSSNPISGELSDTTLSTEIGLPGYLKLPAFVQNPILFSLVDLACNNLTGVSRIDSDITPYFPSLRTLSFQGLASGSFPADWSSLRSVDLRELSNGGRSKPAIDFTGGPVTGAYDDRMSINSELLLVCPDSWAAGGSRSRFSVTASPTAANFVNCKCEPGTFGSPRRGCLRCPAVPVGEPGVTVECKDGALTTHGAWMLLRAGPEPGSAAVSIVACLGGAGPDSNPCLEGKLNETLLSVDEWESYWRGRSPTACRKGYEGRLCSRCSKGFFRSGRSCTACSGRLAWVAPTLSIVLSVALGLVVVQGDRDSSSGLVKTLVMHAQLFSLLPDMSLELAAGARMLTGVSGAGSGGLRLDGLECTRLGYDGFFGPFCVAALMPLAVAVGSLAITLLSSAIWWLRGGRRPGSSAWEDGVVSAVHLWGALMFGSLQSLIAPINCSGYGSTRSRTYVATALWIFCDPKDRSYAGAAGAGLVLAIVYAGMSAAQLVWVHRVRRGGGSHPIVTYHTAAYREDSWMWESVQLGRRVIFVLLNRLTPLKSPAESVGVASVLVIALTLHTWRKPFQSSIDNAAETLSLALLLGTYIAGIIVSNPVYTSYGGITWTFLVVNVLFLAVVGAMCVVKTVSSVASKAMKFIYKRRGGAQALPEEEGVKEKSIELNEK